MSKTVREIAEQLGATEDNLVTLKQRVRDEIKRKKIKINKVGNHFVVSDSDTEKIILSLKTKNEESSKMNKEDSSFYESKYKKLLEDFTKEKEESSKKSEEIRRLNLKIEEYAEDFKNIVKTQQELTARSQQLEHEAREQKLKLTDIQSTLNSSIQDKQRLQDKIDRAEKASLWNRILKKW